MEIKISIEGDKFFYDYFVGKNKEHGEIPLNVTGLDLFCSIINHCHKIHSWDSAKELKEIECKAYLEMHPEFIKEFKDKK